MRELLFASLMADNAMPFCRDLCGYLSGCGLPAQLLSDVGWQVAEQRLYRGEAHLGVVCGLQYVDAVDRSVPPGVELLAAPVMNGQRYDGQPVYFSDVVVRVSDPAASLADLRGRAWAFNEPTSHSGYGVVRFWLAARGEAGPFFGRVVPSGAHQRSLSLVLGGQVDGTAIDSTVLEQELRVDPSLATRIRVIETLGPSPIPPIVVSRALPAATIDRLRAALLAMHCSRAGRAVLDAAQMSRFVAVDDADYAPIRSMSRLGEGLAAWLEV